VRGGQTSSPSFADNGNGIVTDNRTGLMWQQGEAGTMTWDSALSYCEGRSLGGKSDWRLPNIKELESIADDTKANPAIDTTFFPNVMSSNYWSSTTDGGNLTYAWYIFFYYGFVYDFQGSKSNSYYVRCVRGDGSFADSDGDGFSDNEDNCTNTPNGPLLGTCICPYNSGTPCTENSDCGVNGTCSMNQEDTDFDGIGDVCDTPDKIRCLVRQYYLAILDREPDQAGWDWWTSQIEHIISLGINVGEGFQALARFYFNSAEYLGKGKSDSDFVVDVYQTFLQREPDEAGFDFWMAQLTAGLTRGMVITQFAYSDEFKQYMTNLFGPDTTRPENNLLNDFYRGFLNVFPDDAGFNYYLTLMRTYQCNNNSAALKQLCHDIALSFIQSAQYQGRNRTNAEYAEDLYNGILRRGADASGFLFWVNVLNGGMSRVDVLQQFTDGPEFQGRVNAVIAAGCLP
jgi:hypothetical protein